jgi:hypothetical protein
VLKGLLAAQEMAEHIAAIHAARAERLAEADPEGELYTAAEMARARASVAAGLGVSFRLRAEEQDTPAAPRPWWRRLWSRVARRP